MWRSIVSFDGISRALRTFRLGLAVCSYRKGNYDEAILQLNASLELRPRDFLGHVFKASALVKKGCLKQAMPCIDQALKLDPHNLKAMYLKATVLLQLDKVVSLSLSTRLVAVGRRFEGF